MSHAPSLHRCATTSSTFLYTMAIAWTPLPGVCLRCIRRRVHVWAVPLTITGDGGFGMCLPSPSPAPLPARRIVRATAAPRGEQ